jgi:hypothetical protein
VEPYKNPFIHYFCNMNIIALLQKGKEEKKAKDEDLMQKVN